MGCGGVDCPEGRLRPQTLLKWVKRQEIDAEVREGVTSSETQRVKELGMV